jgi:hypothetical protein
VTDIAFAQESKRTDESIKVADLFTWAKITPVNWGRGVLFAVLGLFGAFVTIFGLIGGAVPGTAGQAKIDSDEERLNTFYKRLEELIAAHSPDATAITAVEHTVNNLRDDLRAERWRQFGIATVLYALLGAFFSALLAQDMLQALAFGAGWTSLLGTLGLKKDYAQRKATKDAVMEKALGRAEKVEKIVLGTGDGNLKEKLPSEPLAALKMDVKVAQRL